MSRTIPRLWERLPAGPANRVVLEPGLLDPRDGPSEPGGLLSRVATAEGFLARVQTFVAGTLREGAPSLRTIARRLHMSPRTLQRRLELAGTSFHLVVDGLRRELALAYLSDPGLSLGEVAFLVGFSAPSAFHRAFRKWTGMTPLEHRRSGVRNHVQDDAPGRYPVP